MIGPEWSTIASAPKDGRRVLVRADDEYAIVVRKSGKWMLAPSDGPATVPLGFTPTHYQASPAAV